MRNIKKAIAILLIGIAINACKKEKLETDTSYPEIDMTIANAFPMPCEEVL